MKKFRLISFILFIMAIIINYISSNYSNLVEKYYSNGINIYIVKFLSNLTSTFSFSYLEILIYLLIVSIILTIIYLLYILFYKRNRFLDVLKTSLLNYMSFFCITYFIFIICWGINYNRNPLETSIKNEYNRIYNKDVKDISFSKEDLANLYEDLIEKCNKNRVKVNNDNDGKKIAKELSLKLNDAYKNVHILGLDNRIDYSKSKTIISSDLLTYTGITGIYSPFTGEANINTKQPMISMPFTILHEMAHQRGFASEDEANFLAYIACINNDDEYVRYSGYFMALKYTASALSRVDYDKYKELTKKIDKDVLTDFKYYYDFWDRYQGKVDDISENINNIYLKSNRVKEGTKSYGKVVDLILLYDYLYK